MTKKRTYPWKKLISGAVVAICLLLTNPAAAMAEETVYTCESGGVQYTSLKQAVDAVGEGGSAKITMIADETMTGYVDIGYNKNITLDLAGYHLNYPDSNRYNGIQIDAGSSFTLDDSVGTGTFSSGNDYYGMIMVGGGEFTMNGGTIVQNDNPGTNETGIYANHGKVTINGGTVKARFPFALYGKMGNGLDVTINGGTFVGQLNSYVAGDVSGEINDGNFSVTDDDEAFLIGLWEYNSDVPEIKIKGGEYHGQAAGISIYATDYYGGSYGLANILGDGYIWSDATETYPEENVVYSAKDVTVYPVLTECNVTIGGLEGITYTGADIIPELSISYQGTVLKQGNDYDVQYSNNRNAGTATAAITFHPPYAGTINKSFRINKCPQTLVVNETSYSKKVSEAAFELKAVLEKGDGVLNYSSSDAEIASVDEKGTVTLKGKSGVATITVSASETENYLAAQQTVTVTVEPEYKVISGADSTWQKGSVEGLHITSSAPFEKFASVKVDGMEIAASNYTVKSGSTVVTLKPEYLETLSDGEHSISILSVDGQVEAKFNIKAASTTASSTVTSPKTGDTTVMIGFLSVLCVSGLGVGFAMGRVQRKKVK